MYLLSFYLICTCLAGGKRQMHAIDVGDANTRYSTRAQTGTIKMRKYTNEGFFTEEDDNESVISVGKKSKGSQNVKRSKKRGPAPQDSSGSETELESPITSTRAMKKDKRTVGEESNESDQNTDSLSEDSDSEPVKPVRRGRKPKVKLGKQKKATQNGRLRSSQKKSSLKIESEDENLAVEESESSSTSSSSEGSEDGWQTDTDHDSLVQESKKSQGPFISQQSSDTSDSDSGPARKRRRKSNYAATSRGERSARRTRNQKVKYNEDSANSDSDNNSSAVTVSMHGRVRRPTARARAMLY